MQSSINLMFLCYMLNISICGRWKKTGEGWAMLDVGINSNISYSAEWRMILINDTIPMIDSWVVKTSDLGAHWNTLSKHDEWLFGGVSSLSSDTAIVCSAMQGARYTLDGGNTWQLTITPIFDVASFSRTKDKSMMYGGCSDRRMHISKDYGVTFKSHIIGDLDYGCRYVSLPTKNIWYITAGDFYVPPPPNDTVDTNKLIPITSHLMINMKSGDIIFPQFNISSSSRRRLQAPPNSTWGKIYKTSDGGISWIKLYETWNEFYFNAIDCCDENFCVAVAEGTAVGGSVKPGSRILLTNDGGNNWDIVYYDDNEYSQLAAVACISKNEIYCGGGDATYLNSGYFIKSTNGGKNWTKIHLEANVFFMDMNDELTIGIATAVTPLGSGVIYAYE